MQNDNMPSLTTPQSNCKGKGMSLMSLQQNGLLTEDDWYYNIKKQYDVRAPVEERWYSFSRGLKEKPHGESHKMDFLVEHFVDEITGPYDQDISLLLVGNKGRGKSLCGISLCYYSACELSERLGGKWQDYFDPVRNLAVILEEEATALMAVQDKYQCKNFDDIGIGWSARGWQHEGNQEKNAVFQINRTDSTIQVFSVPNQFLLDKVPRSLVSHYAEMDQQFFAHGFTTIKLFKPTTLFREGKIIQPYLHMDRTKYVLFRIPKPPDDLTEFYKKRRKENKTRATNDRMIKEESVEPEPFMSKHGNTLRMEREVDKYRDDIMKLVHAGENTKAICKMLRIEKKIPATTVKRWQERGMIERLFPTTNTNT